jgi:hypothetical protein
MSAGADVLTAAQVRERIGSVRTWYHRIPIRSGIVTPGVHDSAAMLASLELPADCRPSSSASRPRPGIWSTSSRSPADGAAGQDSTR